MIGLCVLVCHSPGGKTRPLMATISRGFRKTVSKFGVHVTPTFNRKHYPKNTIWVSLSFLTWKTNIHRNGTAGFNRNPHQIYHYFINKFLLCQNWLGLVTFHWLPLIRMWMRETGNASLCEFHWIPSLVNSANSNRVKMCDQQKTDTLWPHTWIKRMQTGLHYCSTVE